MPMSYRKLMLSDHPGVRFIRKARHEIRNATLPAPRFLVLPVLWLFLLIRNLYYFMLRVFLCEPLFKAYCKQYGKGVRTDIFVPFIKGKGDIIVGDYVLIDGKITVAFAARYVDHPKLVVGDYTHIGHECAFVVGKEVTIGSHCLIASGTLIFDSSGHPTDPDDRLAGLPPADDAVRPIHIGDNVWIGKRCMIFPGVTIGEGSVVSAGSVVMRDVPPYTLVAGNPARPSLSLASTQERVAGDG